MGKINVVGMETLLKARDALPKNRLEKWHKAVHALPLLAGLKEMEALGIGRGLRFGHPAHHPVIFTPLCVLPDSWSVTLRGFQFAAVLAFLHLPAGNGNVIVQGPEADAFDSITPYIKIKTRLDTLPVGIKYIPSGDSFGYLMQSRAHALNWHNEMLVVMRDYLHGRDLSSGDAPLPLRELAKKKSSAKEGIGFAGVMKSLETACNAYALGYTLYCGASLISDEMAESIHYLGGLGVSRVKRFDALLGNFLHSRVLGGTRLTKERKKSPDITDRFVKKMVKLVGPSLENELYAFLANQ